MPSRDGHERHSLTLEADLGEELGHLILDLIVAGLSVGDGLLVLQRENEKGTNTMRVSRPSIKERRSKQKGIFRVSTCHLVDGDDDLLHSQSESEQSVLAQLSSLGIGSLELHTHARRTIQTQPREIAVL
jgi:hypothetical protein